MKITCPVCHTTKNIKDEKLIPYRGKTISTRCPNKDCDHRIKIKVPVDLLLTKKPMSKKEQTQNSQNSICPECGHEVPAENRFCLHCGHKMETKKEIPEKKQQPVPKENKLQCKKCGAALQPNDKFCLKCGTPVDTSNLIVEKEKTIVHKEKQAETKQEIKAKIKQKKQPESKQKEPLEIKQKLQPEPKKEEQSKKPIVEKKSNLFCEQCGNPVEAGEKFCPNCGHPLIKMAKPVTPKDKTRKTPPKNKQPEIKQKKRRKGMPVLVKILIGIIVLAGLVLALGYLLDDNLSKGPWNIEVLVTDKVYEPTTKQGAVTHKQALSKVNSSYLIDKNKGTFSLPTGNYQNVDKLLYLDPDKTIKQGDLYVTTVVENGQKGEVKMLLHKISDTYFEAKFYVMLPDEVSMGYLKAHLDKPQKKPAKANSTSKLDKRILGTWVTVGVKSGEIDKQSGWTFLPDGTCYQGTTKPQQGLRKWESKDNKYLSITFPEGTITYKYEIKGNKMYFERYRSYYYYQKQ